MPTAFVLTREYSDHSGYYVVRVYRSKVMATQDLRLVEADQCMTWKLHEVELIGPDYPDQIPEPEMPL